MHMHNFAPRHQRLSPVILRTALRLSSNVPRNGDWCWSRSRTFSTDRVNADLMSLEIKPRIGFKGCRMSSYSTYDIVGLPYKVDMTSLTIPRMTSTGTHVCLECIQICKHPIASSPIGRAVFGGAA